VRLTRLFRGEGTNVAGREPTPGMTWRNQAQRLHREAQVYYFVFKHPRAPWYAKAVAACSAGYVFSPIQLIPSYIPVIGFLDDFLVLFAGAKLLQKVIPPDVLTECRELADAAHIRRTEEMRSTAAVASSVVVVAVWLLAAVGASLLMARLIPHDRSIAK
jgi:uncharacterized membrane protein YkvA (DUF1232 family)